MTDEVWKIGKGVLMCFLSRSLEAVCLGRARLSMANRFPQSLRETFPQSSGPERHCHCRARDKEMEHIAIKQLLIYRLSHEEEKTLLPMDTV